MVCSRKICSTEQEAIKGIKYLIYQKADVSLVHKRLVCWDCSRCFNYRFHGWTRMQIEEEELLAIYLAHSGQKILDILDCVSTLERRHRICMIDIGGQVNCTQVFFFRI
jgi:hypothetical protein